MKHLAALLLVLAAMIAGASNATAEISLLVRQPAAAALAGDELRVVVTATSTFELQDVKARVEDREVALVFSLEADCLPQSTVCTPGWGGTLSLAGLQEGTKSLTATAVDVFGNTGQTQAGFVYDRPPVLAVATPVAESVARPRLRVTASCDDHSQACATMKVSLPYRPSYGMEIVLLTGQSTIDTTISLADYEGQAVLMRFEGTDSAGQIVREERTVYVESSVKLTKVLDCGGPVLDADAARALFLEQGVDRAVLKIANLLTGGQVAVRDQTGRRPQRGFLTPKGAIFTELVDGSLTQEMFDYRDGSLVGLPSPGGSLVRVKGTYAAWPALGGALLRDLLAGTDTLIPKPGFSGYLVDLDVAGNGDVALQVGFFPYFGVHLYHQFATTGLGAGYGPLTDGINVVYACDVPPATIALHGAQGDTTLATFAAGTVFQAGRDYLPNGGWVAFIKPSPAGPNQVRLRSPQGDERQVSFFGISSGIDNLDTNGDLIFTNGGSRYLAREGKAAVRIGTTLGRSFAGGGQWLVAVGRTLFSVDLSPKPDGDLVEDGIVDIRDALQALRATVGLAPCTADEVIRGDVAPFLGGRPEPDGSLTLADALIILKRAVGLLEW